MICSFVLLSISLNALCLADMVGCDVQCSKRNVHTCSRAYFLAPSVNLVNHPGGEAAGN